MTVEQPSDPCIRMLGLFHQNALRRQRTNSVPRLFVRLDIFEVSRRSDRFLARPRSNEGRSSRLRLFTLIDEFTREYPGAIEVRKGLGRQQLSEALAELMLLGGARKHIRSDNEPESTARALRQWLATV